MTNPVVTVIAWTLIGGGLLIAAFGFVLAMTNKEEDDDQDHRPEDD